MLLQILQNIKSLRHIKSHVDLFYFLSQTGVLNPFPDGTNLTKKLHDLAKHLHVPSNQTKYEAILNARNLTSTKIERDLCGTRVSSAHGTYRTALKNKENIKTYELGAGLDAFLTNGVWDAVRDVEGVLEACAFLCTLSQNEKKFNAAYGPVVKMHLHKTLTADTLYVIDVNNWGGKARPNRINVPVDDLTSIGNEALVRAIIECERRFFGSRLEDPLADTPGVVVSLELSEQEKGVLLFDPRTCLDAEIMSTEEWREAVSVAKIFYVDFYKTCKKTDRNAARTLNPEPIILQTPTPEPAKRRRVSLFDNQITGGRGDAALVEHVEENHGQVEEN